MELPVRGAKAARLAAELLEGLCVLVCEEDADARDLVFALLDLRGASVRAAASAGEAFELLAAFHPDVLVSDIAMPGGRG